MRLLRAISLLAITACSLALPVSASAQNPGRVLNGFRFLPSTLIPSPFVTTYIRTATGGGLAFDLSSLFIDVNGDTLGTLTGNVAFMTLDFEFQQQFGGWLAVRAGFTGSARMGIDEQSVLAEGLTGTASVKLGATARIWHNDKWLVSGALDFGRNDFVGLDPFGFAQQVVDSGGLTADNSLVETNNATTGRGSGRVAWAPKPWLGLTGFLGAASTDVSSGSSNFIVGGGATVAVDLKPLNWPALGFLLGYVSESVNNGNDIAKRSTGFTGAVMYTGRDDFSVGLEATSRKFTRNTLEPDFSALIVTFNIRYWFSGG
jgi:hypothetical protein